MLLDSDHLTKCVRALAGIAAIRRAAAVVSSSIAGDATAAAAGRDGGAAAVKLFPRSHTRQPHKSP